MAVAALTVAGCARGKRGANAAADSAFVATVIELRKVETNVALDSVRRAAERGRVLQRRGLTAAALEAQSRALAQSPARATAVWGAIARATNGGEP